MRQFLQLREPSRNFCSPYSSVLALIAASHSSLLLASFCLCVPLPSITYLLHHRLLSSTVQVFRGSCPNPKTGCSYSSAASSPERRQLQYFKICSHPNLRRKTEIRDSLQKFKSSKKPKNQPTPTIIYEHQCILCHLKWNIFTSLKPRLVHFGLVT